MSAARERTLFVAVALLHLVPLWAVEYLPLTDLPRHTALAYVLKTLLTDSGTVIHHYYQLTPFPQPNWIVYPILLPLMAVVPDMVAEKLVLSAIVVGLPLAFRYAAGAVRPGRPYVAWLIFPFLYNLLFNLGFYNFWIGTILFFLAVGFYLRRYRNFSGRDAVLFGLLGLLTYFSHIGALAPLGIVLAVFCIWQAACDLRRSGLVPALRCAVHHTLLPLLALLPTIGLLGGYLLYQPDSAATLWYSDTWQRLRGLFTIYPIESHGPYDQLFRTLLVGAVVIALAGALRLRRRAWRWQACDGLAAAALVLAVISLLVPDQVKGGSFVVDRLQFFPWFLIILWLAAQDQIRPVERIVPLLATAAAAGLIVQNLQVYRQADPYLREYQSVADAIAPGSTVLALSVEPFNQAPGGILLSERIIVFTHAVARLAAGRPVVDLNDYQSGAGVFPVMYRPERNPFRYFQPERVPPDPKFATYEARAPGARIDYVLLWGPEQAPDAQPVLDTLAAQGYRLVDRSRPNGFLRVYRRPPA